MSELNERRTTGLGLTEFSRRHLGAGLALFAAEDWQTYTTDPERTYRAVTAPGRTTLVALAGDAVAGLVQLHSDGEIEADLSALTLRADPIPGFRLRQDTIACAR